jgi:hypothetical protein
MAELSKPKILLLSGKAQHGKDSSANIFKKYFDDHNKKSIILHYGDILKFVSSKYFGASIEKNKESRSIWQYVGTDLARKHYSTIWVDIVILFAKALFFDYDYIVIADFRFPDEYHQWKKDGYDATTIRIIRLNFDNGLTLEQQSHLSEISLDDFNFDYVVESESGLEYLEVEIEKVIKNL